MNRKINIQSEDYNNGWLHGVDLFVSHIWEGFNGNVPDWIVDIAGGMREVRQALRNVKHPTGPEEDAHNYETGVEAGYQEFLEELENKYTERGEEMPPALLKIMQES